MLVQSQPFTMKTTLNIPLPAGALAIPLNNDFLHWIHSANAYFSLQVKITAMC